MEWTDESIVRLKALWTEGLSTAEIGRRMGISKNAVVGKAHRLLLASRPSPIRRDADGLGRARATPRRVTGPTLPSLAIDAPAAPVAHLPPLDSQRPDPQRPDLQRPDLQRPDLQRPDPQRAAPPPTRPAALVLAPRPIGAERRRNVACCWPIGEPGTRSFRFCDEESTPGKPYCATHAALAYVRIRDRREDAA